MNINVNLEAAIGVLAFLATAFVLGVAVIIMLHTLKTRRRGRAGTLSIAAVSFALAANS